MRTPTEVLTGFWSKVKKEHRVAFLATVLVGLLIHLPAMISDIPNHDGLSSMYFDQNMITSGRWFLSVACGISSYFTLPWIIGIFSFLYLGLAAAFLVDLLEVKRSLSIVLIAGLFVAFPSLASTFAYVFTMDGYMMAVLLAVLAVWATKRFPYGFVVGGVCLALSMGIYQMYLAIAILLSMYSIVIFWMEEDTLQLKMRTTLHYLYMGVLGSGLYYVMLRLLLFIQGKELDTYQGINSMDVESMGGTSLVKRVLACYSDFAAFTAKGGVLFHDGISLLAVGALVVSAGILLVKLFCDRKWWKKPSFFVIMCLGILGVPVAANVVLIISPDVTYHLLMRYQWALFPILAVALVDRFRADSKADLVSAWLVCLGGLVLILHYGVTDNIAYSNLEKKYEKTYAYCLRLLDRIEQTPGYYQGIPVAMIGVVGDEAFPSTDLTKEVTAPMIGINGDVLLYTGANYEAFIRNYLGATLNMLPPESMAEMYYSEEYRSMHPFPASDSIQIIDGVLYVKTENMEK